MAELQEKARAVNGDRGQNSGYLWVKGHEWRRRHKGTFWHTGQCPVSHLQQQFMEVYVNIHQAGQIKTVRLLYVSYTGKISTHKTAICTLGCKYLCLHLRKICERSIKILSQVRFFPSLFLMYDLL